MFTLLFNFDDCDSDEICASLKRYLGTSLSKEESIFSKSVLGVCDRIFRLEVGSM